MIYRPTGQRPSMFKLFYITVDCKSFCKTRPCGKCRAVCPETIVHHSKSRHFQPKINLQPLVQIIEPVHKLQFQRKMFHHSTLYNAQHPVYNVHVHCTCILYMYNLLSHVHIIQWSKLHYDSCFDCLLFCGR